MSVAQPTEKVKLTEKDFNLINQAHDVFNKQQYDQCLQILNQLETTIGPNYKLTHNKALVDFYQSNCKSYNKLLKFLESKQLDKLDSQNSITMRATVIYNRAVIYYHKRMHFTAIQVITPLLEKVNELEAPLVANIGLLLISLLLATNQLKKGQAFLKELEIVLGLNGDMSEGNILPENLTQIDDSKRMFKLMALLTNVLNLNSVVIPNDQTAEFGALKAHQFYLMKDFQMAAKQLTNICNYNYTIEKKGEDLNTCIANNMGIIHLRVRHYALAAEFFQNAINFDKKIASNLPNVPLHHLSAARSREVLYNLGISMLHLKRPNEAFQCFLIPLKTYHRNPRLWFRIAEACIMENEMKRSKCENKPIVASVICPGSRKKYILQPSPKLKYPEDGQCAAIPDTNLEFASLCLRSALFLVNSYKSQFSGSSNALDETLTWSSVTDENICSPSAPLSKESFENLTAAIYAAYSFVSLRLGHYIDAFEHASNLLKMENISDAYKMLANMYCGESLVKMNKLSEARPYLEAKFVTSLNGYDFETKDWQVKSLDAAQSIIRYNLIVTMILQREYEMAKSLMITCNHPIIAAKMTSLKTYLEIIAKGPA